MGANRRGIRTIPSRAFEMVVSASMWPISPPPQPPKAAMSRSLPETACGKGATILFPAPHQPAAWPVGVVAGGVLVEVGSNGRAVLLAPSLTVGLGGKASTCRVPRSKLRSAGTVSSGKYLPCMIKIHACVCTRACVRTCVCMCVWGGRVNRWGRSEGNLGHQTQGSTTQHSLPCTQFPVAEVGVHRHCHIRVPTVTVSREYDGRVLLGRDSDSPRPANPHRFVGWVRMGFLVTSIT
jgi:hypothetical protein